jgi:argininosuccinate lyase
MAIKKQRRSRSGVPLWHGRFDRSPAGLTQSFVESLSFDRRLYKHDIAGSIAHARMLKSAKLITASELKAIERGLKAIAKRIESGTFRFKTADEDIHMAVEGELTRQIGEPGKKLHTARSRNDQVALDLRLYLRDAVDNHLLEAITSLQHAFLNLADREGFVPMPGFTHLQHAQPILAAATLLASIEQLERDRERLLDCRRRIDVCPLGAAALAGTTLPINRNQVARELGFAQICRNSLDAVSDRDFAVEFVFDLAMIAMHLSRWAEDWVIWSSPEFNFVLLDQAHCTGSSIMPQKRNPDVLELIRGKTGGIYGKLLALLTMLKGLPGTYNRDMQEDKRWVFEAYDMILASLTISADLVAASHLNPEAMARQLSEGFLEATGLAEYLVRRGTPFRQAHRLVGQIVAHCEKKDKKLTDLSLGELRQFSDNIRSDVHKVLDPSRLVKSYRSEGSAGTKEISSQLRHWHTVLASRS